ncbi:Gfo/Idh/MocA family protein [Thermodesulfobacteriota bacterium]
MSRLRAAIVGLGQVGIRFDLEPDRFQSGEIWTHFSAYEKLESYYELVAAVDPDRDKWGIAKKRKHDLACFPSIEDLLENAEIDVVSICTPDSLHFECLGQTLDRVHGIFLEKPICGVSEIEHVHKVNQALKKAGNAIRVNYYKRKEPAFIKALEYMNQETPLYVSAKYSGPFEAVGSHAVNLLIAMVPSMRLIKNYRFMNEEGDGYSTLFESENGCLAELIYCGPRYNLIFELDIIGRNRRVVLERNFSSLKLYGYRDSQRYEHYKEMELIEEMDVQSNTERFVPFLLELIEDIRANNPNYDNWEEAVKTQEVMCRIAKASYD